MPSLLREDYPYNAKITRFNCDFCGIQAFARYKKTKFCSDLCRHNAYLERKMVDESIKRDYNLNITQYSRKKEIIEKHNEPNYIKQSFVGAFTLKKYFKEKGIKITLKYIREISVGQSKNFNHRYVIKRLNLKVWIIKFFYEEQGYVSPNHSFLN